MAMTAFCLGADEDVSATLRMLSTLWLAGAEDRPGPGMWRR